MGSLTSRPKIQPTPQVIYTPVSQVSSTAPSTAEGSSALSSSQNDTQSSNEAAVQENSQDASEARANNLLLRSRGRQGTVLTSFRGVFSDLANSGAAKTLLGE